MAGETKSGWRLPVALPPIRRAGALVYVVVWLTFFGLFVVGTVGISLRNLEQGASISYTWAPLGLAVDHDRDGAPYRVVTVGGSARRAGVRPGDMILAAEGLHSAAATADPAIAQDLARRLLKPEGAPAYLIVRSGRGRPRAVTLTHRMANAIDLYAPTGLTPRSLTWANVLLFATPPLVLSVGAICLFWRRREPLAAILSLSLLALGSVLGNQLAFWETVGLRMIWLWVPASCIGLSGLYLMALVFPSGRFMPRWTAILALSFPFWVLLANAVTASGWVALAYVLAGIGLMIARYRTENLDERRQWRWAMLGLAAGVVIIVIAQMILFPRYFDAHRDDLAIWLWSWIVTPFLLSLVSALVVGGLVLSVLRYRLYDTQAAISRSLVYAVLTILLVGVFAGSEKIIEIIGEEYFGERIGALAGGLGAAFAAITIGPLHHRVSHWSEHLLRRDLVRLRRDLPALLLDVGETSTPEAVAELLIEQVIRGFHAVCAAVIDGECVLAARGVDANRVAAWRTGHAERTGSVDQQDGLFPVRVALARGRARWLLVGARPDGSLLGTDERQLLDELAGPIAAALRLAQQHQGEHALIRLVRELERRLGTIETLVQGRTARA